MDGGVDGESGAPKTNKRPHPQKTTTLFFDLVPCPNLLSLSLSLRTPSHQDDTRILTASGDQTVGLWDSLEARALGTARGHRGSVKAVAPCPGAPDVFASGGRDGALLLWDARVPGRHGGGGGGGGASSADLSPVAAVAAAHGAPCAATPAPRRGGGPGGGRAAPHSVTSATFLADGRVLASGGADGVVRLWDVRALRPVGGVSGGGGGGGGRQGGGAATAAVAEVCPVAEAAAAASGAGACCAAGDAPATTPARTPHPPYHYPHGVCGLALDPSAGARLAASVASRGHFLVDAGRLAAAGGGCGGGAGAAASGHPPGCVIALARDGPGSAPSSFYVKAAFSGDGSHLVGGCGDGVARVWHTARPGDAPTRLVGHGAEVTGVAWCPTDGGEVATCSDDATVRVWRLVRREEAGRDGGGGRAGGGGEAGQQRQQPPPPPQQQSPPGTPVGEAGWPGRPAPSLAASTAPRPPRPTPPHTAARPTAAPPAIAPPGRLAQRSIFDFVSPMQQVQRQGREEGEEEEEEQENRAPSGGAEGGLGSGGRAKPPGA